MASRTDPARIYYETPRKSLSDVICRAAANFLKYGVLKCDFLSGNHDCRLEIFKIFAPAARQPSPSSHYNITLLHYKSELCSSLRRVMDTMAIPRGDLRLIALPMGSTMAISQDCRATMRSFAYCQQPSLY